MHGADASGSGSEARRRSAEAFCMGDATECDKMRQGMGGAFYLTQSRQDAKNGRESGGLHREGWSHGSVGMGASGAGNDRQGRGKSVDCI